MTEVLKRIITYLEDGPRNTPEILEHLKMKMRQGIVLENLQEILEESDKIIRVGYIKRSGIASGGYNICEWATQVWIDENVPDWEEGENIFITYQLQQEEPKYIKKEGRKP